MKALSVVFFPGAVPSVPVLRLSAVCLATPREALCWQAGHKAGAAGIPQPAFEGGRRDRAGGPGVLDFSTLGSLLVLTVCELDILCNNAVLKSALFMRTF